MMPLLLLASASPRRSEILSNLGYQIEVCATNIDETPHHHEHAHDYVQRMAVEKNHAALQRLPEKLQTQLLSSPIVSADTTVALHGRILGKPENADEAHTMLCALSGSIHQVLTAVCVSFQGQTRHIVQQSDVQFKILTNAEIAAYIATGEPMDKAGAYGIQGIAGAFVQHLSGSFTGVMGLPVFETVQLLRECGAPVPPFAV